MGVGKGLPRKAARKIGLALVNHVFCGTHCFGAKRKLLRFAGIPVGEGTNVVGPIRIGTVADLSIGEQTWIGRDFTVDGNGEVRIGDRVDIAPEVAFETGGHAIGSHARRAGDGQCCCQQVGNGSWICARTTVCGQTSIGSGSIIAAGSVVIADVAPDTMVAGVPAQVKRVLDQAAE